METIRERKATELAASDGEPLTQEAFVASLKAQSDHYHHKHPLHVNMNAGRLNRTQIQSWVANRYYYQAMIPVKDAAILSNCPDTAVRRVWIQRILDHDGTAAEQGGIEDWLRLCDAVGLSRQEVLDERHLLPGVRFAVDAYVTFARTRPWIEAVAASLTELFAPDLMQERIAAFERHYSWVDPKGLTYLKTRLKQAPRDAHHALALVTEYCRTRDQQERALVALEFKCDVLWSMLDAIPHTVAEESKNA
ncbi:MAG: pyrroloquinoline-quinone synthase PqqC [Ktedonobacteraceae bacterium]